MKCAEVLSARTSSTAVHLPLMSERPLDTPTIPYIFHIYICWLWKDKLNFLTSPKPRLQEVPNRLGAKTAIWAHVIIYTMDIGISCAASPRIIQPCITQVSVPVIFRALAQPYSPSEPSHLTMQNEHILMLI